MLLSTLAACVLLAAPSAGALPEITYNGRAVTAANFKEFSQADQATMLSSVDGAVRDSLVSRLTPAEVEALIEIVEKRVVQFRKLGPDLGLQPATVESQVGGYERLLVFLRARRPPEPKPKGMVFTVEEFRALPVAKKAEVLYVEQDGPFFERYQATLTREEADAVIVNVRATAALFQTVAEKTKDPAGTKAARQHLLLVERIQAARK